MRSKVYNQSVVLAGHHGNESFLTTKITFLFYELNFIFMGAVIKMPGFNTRSGAKCHNSMNESQTAETDKFKISSAAPLSSCRNSGLEMISQISCSLIAKERLHALPFLVAPGFTFSFVTSSSALQIWNKNMKKGFHHKDSQTDLEAYTHWGFVKQHRHKTLLKLSLMHQKTEKLLIPAAW